MAFIKHGVLLNFYYIDAKYELGLYYLLFGRIRLFEINHIKIKKKPKKKKGKVPGFVKYIPIKINIDIFFPIMGIDSNTAIVNSCVTSIIDTFDTLTYFDISKKINYSYDAFSLKVRIMTGLSQIIRALYLYMKNHAT